MIKELHILLSYQCTKECDHCFVYSSPFASSEGTFTFSQIQEIVNQANKLGTIKRFYFEGGEPFLFYPLLKESMKLVKDNGYEIGIVTNGYWITNVEDAKLWLKDLAEIGIDDLSVSDDCYHNETEDTQTGSFLLRTASELGIPSSIITINEPVVSSDNNSKGKIIGGDVRFRGRAVDKILKEREIPTKSYKQFTNCNFEELKNPERVHLDAYGSVQICQGISMGNMWETPLSDLILNYEGKKHPIWGPIILGGPKKLADTYKINHNKEYVDECHMCYDLRIKMRESSHENSIYLTPDQVYGK